MDLARAARRFVPPHARLGRPAASEMERFSPNLLPGEEVGGVEALQRRPCGRTDPPCTTRNGGTLMGAPRGLSSGTDAEARGPHPLGGALLLEAEGALAQCLLRIAEGGEVSASGGG